MVRISIGQLLVATAFAVGTTYLGIWLYQRAHAPLERGL